MKMLKNSQLLKMLILSFLMLLISNLSIVTKSYVYASETLTIHKLSKLEIKKIISDAPSYKDFPKANAAVLFRNTLVCLHNDRHRSIEEEVLLKIFTGKGKAKYGDIKLPYDKRYEKITVIKAETFSIKGKSIPVMKGADNTIIPPDLTDAAVYDAVQERVVSMSKVEPGAVIHWIVKRDINYPPKERFLWGSHAFMGKLPIIKEIFKLKYDNSLNMKYHLLNGLNAPTLAKKDTFNILTWQKENTHMLQSEWRMTNTNNIVPRMLYSVATNWKQIADWFRTGIKNALDTKSDKINSLVQKLIKNSDSKKEKINKIYRWVADNVRSIYLPLGLRGYIPSNPETVLENQYGDNLDNSILLITMLRFAKFDAEPVLFQDDDFFIPEDFPSAFDFNSVGVVISGLETGDVWLEPSYDNLQTGFFLDGQGTSALIISDDKYKVVTVPVWKAESSESNQQIELAIEKNGMAIGTFKWNGSGYFDYYSRAFMRERTPRARKMFYSQMLNTGDFPALITSLKEGDWKDFSKQTNIKADIKVPNLGIIEGKSMIVKLPGFPIRFSKFILPRGNAKRFYTSRLQSTGIMKSVITIYIPKGFHTIYSTSNKNVESSGLDVSQTVKVAENKIVITIKWIWKLKELTPKQFVETKNVYDIFRNLEQNVVLLEKK